MYIIAYISHTSKSPGNSMASGYAHFLYETEYSFNRTIDIRGIPSGLPDLHDVDNIADTKLLALFHRESFLSQAKFVEGRQEPLV